MKYRYSLLFTLCFGLVGCDQPQPPVSSSSPPSSTSTSKPVVKVDAEQLQRSWVIQELDATNTALEDAVIPPGFAIDSNLKVSGYSGCNRFNGQAELTSDNQFRVNDIVSTRMQCLYPEHNQLETQIIDILSQWTKVSLEEEVLSLTGNANSLTAKPQAISDLSAPESTDNEAQ